VCHKSAVCCLQSETGNFEREQNKSINVKRSVWMLQQARVALLLYHLIIVFVEAKFWRGWGRKINIDKPLYKLAYLLPSVLLVSILSKFTSN